MLFSDVIKRLSGIEGHLGQIKNMLIDISVLKAVGSIHLIAPEHSTDDPSRRILSPLQSNLRLCYKGLWRSLLRNPWTPPGGHT